MGAQVMGLERGQLLKIDPIAGTGVLVRAGQVWLTRDDGRDYVLKQGDGMALAGEGTTVISGLEPSMLELYREDATALRRTIERGARRQRAVEIWAFVARLFR